MPNESNLLRQLLDVAVSSGLCFDDQMERILLRGCRQLDMELGILAKVTGERYEVIASVPLSDLEVEPGETFDLANTYCSATIEATKAIGFHQASGTEWERHPCYSGFGLEAYIGAPVFVDGELYGTINFSRRSPRERPVSEEEFDFVTLAAGWAGNELARERSRDDLSRARSDLGAVLHSAVDGIMGFESVRDAHGEIIDFRWKIVNPAGAQMVGRPQGDLLGGTMLDELPGNKTDGLFDKYKQVVETGESTQFIHRYAHDGIDAWFRISAVKTGDGFSVGFADITEAKQAEFELLEAKREVQTILDTVPTLIWYKDTDSRIVRTNRAVDEAMGLPATQISGMSTEQAHPDEAEQYVRDDQEVVRTGLPKRGIIEKVCFGPADERWVSTDKIPVHGPSGDVERILVVASDITRLKKTEDALRRLAEYDPLTDLRNRASFAQQLELVTAQWKQGAGDPFAVLYLDFDRFKIVNDSLGHHAGDELLRSIAERLRSAVKPEDVVGRLGGDEFAVVLRRIETIEQAVMVAERLLKRFEAAHDIEGHPITSTASIGVAVCSEHAAMGADVLRDADGAMYEAKANGRNCVVAVTDEARDAARQRLDVESRLRAILDDSALGFAYLPIFRVDDGAIVGFETFARWPDGGVTPDEFIPIAEESGLIVDIGEHAIASACQRLAEWRTMLPPDAFLTVKCSRRQVFHPTTPETLERAISESGVDPASLVLEIEESVIAEPRADVRSAIEALRATGVRIAVDNFGAGASSLRVLRDGLIDVVKFDRSFLTEETDPEESRAVLSAISTLSQRLGLPAVAEGVQSDAQRQMLQSIGCQMCQGHALSMPLDRDGAARLLQGPERLAA